MYRGGGAIELQVAIFDAGQEALEVPAPVLAWIGIQETGDAFLHGFGKRRRGNGQHRRSREGRFDRVEPQRFSLGQPGEQVVERAVRACHIALMPPIAYAWPERRERVLQSCERFMADGS